MAEKHPSFVEVSGLTLAYREASFLKRLFGKNAATNILTNLHFSLHAGEHKTLFGKEGSGKTTLLKALAGIMTPSAGHILINGQRPHLLRTNGSWYISPTTSLNDRQTVHHYLRAIAQKHEQHHGHNHFHTVQEHLRLHDVGDHLVSHLSERQKIRVLLAQAALQSHPIILLDDIADYFESPEMRHILKNLFHGRTVLIATRLSTIAEGLQQTMLLLHHGTLHHHGTIEELGTKHSYPKMLDVWIEGIGYPVVRELRDHTGVTKVRLLSVSGFAGHRLELTIKSPRYLPVIYDALSKIPVVRIEERPVSLPHLVDQIL